MRPSDNSGPGLRLFVCSAAAILIVTGMAKIFSALPYSKVMMIEDPIFHLQFRVLLLEVGIVEVLVALFCLTRRPSQSILLIAFLSYNFVLYRVGLWWIDFGICPCMGTLTQSLGIPSRIADALMKSLAGYLFIGSTILIARNYWKLGRSKNASPSDARSVRC
jgi:hypothetical protein